VPEENYPVKRICSGKKLIFGSGRLVLTGHPELFLSDEVFFDYSNS
jgi:hypothetical protein